MLTALFIACTEPATAPAASVDEIDAFWMAVGDPSDWTLPSVDESGDYSAFPQSERNPINEAKVELGRQLFYETGLAAAGVHADNVGTWSCASCHDPASGFRSGNTIGRGIGEGAEGQGADREMVREYADKLDHADISPMSEMTIINAGYRAEISGWQGEFDSVNDPMAYDIPRNSLLESGHDGLEAFIQAGLGAHGFWGDDAAVAPEASVLNPASADYDAWLELFRAAFPGEHPDRLINQTNTALALAAFVRTVVPSEAPFQKMLRSPASDEAPMSSAAVRGATLFFGEARCSACHSSPGLNSATFHTLGTAFVDPTQIIPGTKSSIMEVVTHLGEPIRENQGRANVSLQTSDIGAFAVPSVYGAGSPGVQAWGHGGAHDSLEGFIAHKVGGSDGATIDPNLKDNLSPVLFGQTGAWLSDEQIADIAAFISEGLEDPTLVERYGAPPSGPGIQAP